MKVRRLTFEDRKIIEDCLKKGIRYLRISEILKFSRPSISKEVAKNGGRSAYNAEQAQLRARNALFSATSAPIQKDLFEQDQDKNCIDFNAFFNDLKSRVEKLEMHLEIILDVLKKNGR